MNLGSNSIQASISFLTLFFFHYCLSSVYYREDRLYVHSFMFVGYTALDPADVKNKKKMGVYSKMAAENYGFCECSILFVNIELKP